MSYTIVPFEPVLIDTNVLLYAVDQTEPRKHNQAKAFITKRINSDFEMVITDQNLSEFFSYAVKKGQILNCRDFITQLLDTGNVRCIAPTAEDTMAAALCAKELRMSFWDARIAQTMFENRVFTICTEDKAFLNDKRINVVNPFQKS